MLIIFAIFFSIFSIIVSYRFKKEDDPIILIKILGYYILSITTISVNSIYQIPIGFIIAYLLADNTFSNKRSKKTSALLGLLNYIICVTLYFTIIV